jgi:hypothetical protein
MTGVMFLSNMICAQCYTLLILVFWRGREVFLHLHVTITLILIRLSVDWHQSLSYLELQLAMHTYLDTLVQLPPTYYPYHYAGHTSSKT